MSKESNLKESNQGRKEKYYCMMKEFSSQETKDSEAWCQRKESNLKDRKATREGRRKEINEQPETKEAWMSKESNLSNQENCRGY
jgi:hypothetical protein